MPIVCFPKCHRGRDDCQPVHCIDNAPEDTDEEDLFTVNYTPTSFVCSGIINDGARKIQQDCYRLCFKNDCVDDMSDNDEQDLTHVISCAAQALALGATVKVNGGSIEVPTLQGKADETAA